MKNNNILKTKSGSTEIEKVNRDAFFQLFKNSPIPDSDLMFNLGLYIRRQDLTRILFMNEIYQKILDIHGIVTEFGVRWGQNLALFESFRGIYEPFNYNRKFIGFDTFEGFPSINEKDGKSEFVSIGSYSVTKDYEKYLSQVLDYHEIESPISHIKKYRLIKGDASIELEKYLQENPETIIALAYFDFDIYNPTKRCLELIQDHIAKGTIIGFDELNVHDFPGETLAFKEIFDLKKSKIVRSKFSAENSYIVID